MTYFPYVHHTLVNFPAELGAAKPTSLDPALAMYRALVDQVAFPESACASHVYSSVSEIVTRVE